MREDRTIRIPLTRGLFAVIDAADEALVRRYTWNANRSPASLTWYAWTEIPGQGRVSMHRLLVDPAPDMEVDHINRDGLDNRRSNLREVTPTQNKWNTGLRRDNKSGYRGVFFNRSRGKWQAQISAGKDGNLLNLGFFEKPDDAARAYDAKALELRGDLAQLNFPVVDIKNHESGCSTRCRTVSDSG